MYNYEKKQVLDALVPGSEGSLGWRNKCFSFGSDTENTMTGWRNGVSARLQRTIWEVEPEVPALIRCFCGLHLIALSAAKIDKRFCAFIDAQSTMDKMVTECRKPGPMSRLGFKLHERCLTRWTSQFKTLIAIKPSARKIDDVLSTTPAAVSPSMWIAIYYWHEIVSFISPLLLDLQSQRMTLDRQNLLMRTVVDNMMQRYSIVCVPLELSDTLSPELYYTRLFENPDPLAAPGTQMMLGLKKSIFSVKCQQMMGFFKEKLDLVSVEDREKIHESAAESVMDWCICLDTTKVIRDEASAPVSNIPGLTPASLRSLPENSLLFQKLVDCFKSECRLSSLDKKLTRSLQSSTDFESAISCLRRSDPPWVLSNAGSRMDTPACSLI